jgi:hypothetical protein
VITTAQYFRNPTTGEARPHTTEQEAAADDLLTRRNALRQEWMDETGETCPIDQDTGCEISGSKGGAGDGGFRLDSATTGTGHSSHKILYVQKPDGTWIKSDAAQAGVDDFDPKDAFDRWLDQFEDGHGGNSKLEEYGLYREHPDDTPGWCHLTTRAPHSGHRTFKP